jgi:hypothetical protein
MTWLGSDNDAARIVGVNGGVTSDVDGARQDIWEEDGGGGKRGKDSYGWEYDLAGSWRVSPLGWWAGVLTALLEAVVPESNGVPPKN